MDILKRKTWSSETQKKLHQAKIGVDVKESIRTLSIINGNTISDTTDELLRQGISTHESEIQKYHYNRSKGL